MKRDLRLFIEDIQEAINDIEESVKDLTKDQFVNNKDVKEANIRRIEIIGEAVKNIPDKFREKYSEVQWKKIAGLRDVIIHAYFGINLDRIWEAIKTDLPDLKQKILKIKNDMEEEHKSEKNQKEG